MAISAGTAFVDILPNMSKFAPALAGASRGSAGLSTLAKGALAVGTGLGVSVKMATDFEQSMRNVNSIAKLSEGQFASLSDDVLKLAGPTAQAPKTLADGLYELVSSGFDAKQSLTILKSTAVAATAGLTDTGTATEAVASILNAYQLPASKAQQVSDELFKTVEVGSLTFEELAQNIGDGLSVANSINVPLSQVGAALATLTNQGESTPEAMTKIKAAMTSLVKPSEAMTGVMKKLGVESGAELIKKYGSLQEALVAVRGATDGSAEAMNELFPNVRAAQGALALTGPSAEKAADHLREVEHQAGASGDAFKEQSKALALQWQELKARLSVLAIGVGNELIPALNDAAKWLNEGGLGKAAAAVAPILDTVRDAVVGIVDVFGKLPGPLQAAAGGVAAFTLAVKAGLGPWGLAITAATALSAAFQNTSDAQIQAEIAQGKWNESLPEVVRNIIALRDAMKSAESSVDHAAAGIAAGFANVYGGAKKMGAGVKVALDGVAQSALNVFDTLIPGLKNVGKRMAQALRDGIKSTGQSAIKAANSLVSNAKTSADRKAQEFGKTGKLLGDNLTKGLASTVGDVGEAGKRIAQNGVLGSNSQRGAFGNSGKGHGQSLAGGLRSTQGTVSSAGSSIANSAAAAARGASQSFFAAGASMGNSLAAGLRSAVAGVQAAANAVAAAAASANKHRAGGGPVSAGRSYIVGEQGQELFVPKTNGYIIPNHALPTFPAIAGAATGGPAQFTITNWQTGQGYFRSIADGAVDNARRYDGQRSRMRTG